MNPIIAALCHCLCVKYVMWLTRLKNTGWTDYGMMCMWKRGIQRSPFFHLFWNLYSKVFGFRTTCCRFHSFITENGFYSFSLNPVYPPADVKQVYSQSMKWNREAMLTVLQLQSPLLHTAPMFSSEDWGCVCESGDNTCRGFNRHFLICRRFIMFSFH